MRFGAIIKILVALVLVLVVAVALFLKSMDFNEYKGLLTDQVKAATGRDLVIQGDFDLKLSLSPALTVSNLSFANASWGSRPEMVKLERLEVVVNLISLLSGDIQVKRLVLISPDILLETNPQGQGNWTFGKKEKGAASSKLSVSPAETAAIPLVNEIQIKNASLSYRDGATQKIQNLSLETLTGRATNLDSPLELEIIGSYSTHRLETKAKTGSVNQLLNPTAPFPLQLEARLSENIVKVEGTIKVPLEGKGLNLQCAVESPDLAKLSSLTGSNLPSIGPFHLAGHVTDPGGAYSIKDLSVKLGRSTLAGAISVKTDGKRPYLKAEVASLNLEPDEFSLKKDKPEGEAAQEKAETKEPKKDRVFSNDPFPLDGLRAVDAKIGLAQGRVASSGMELQNMAFDMTLENGRLSIPQWKADISTGGTLLINLSLDGQKPQAALKAAIQVKNLDLPPLLKKMEATNLLSAGKADVEMDLAGSGESLRALMAGLDGKVSLVMGEGRIENKYMDFMAADLMNLIIPGGAKKEYTAVNCMVCRFDIKEGLASDKGLLLDTEQMTVAGEGSINLAEESLRLTMTPQPKEKSLVSLAVPVHIRGTFLEPSVQPDAASVVKGVAGAILGGALMGPVGVLISFSKEGRGEKNPCLEALAGKGKGAKPSSPATKEATPPAPPQEEPAEKVKGILKGLGGLFK